MVLAEGDLHAGVRIGGAPPHPVPAPGTLIPLPMCAPTRGRRSGSAAFRWTAPEQMESVVLHAAANFANDDASELGDTVRVGSWHLRSAEAGLFQESTTR